MRSAWRHAMDRLPGGSRYRTGVGGRVRARRRSRGWRPATPRPPPPYFFSQALTPKHLDPQTSGGLTMLRFRVPVALLAGLLVGALASRAAAQGTACTQPYDPACNHLKCYQIKDKPSTVVSKTPVLQLDNQFGREVVYRFQAVLLCVPTQKSCCCPGSPGCLAGATGCSGANCKPNPVPAPPLPHFKCYKIKAKTCPNGSCATVANFASKVIHVNLRTQFGQELNVPVGKPQILCVPADKQVVGNSTSTTST